MWSSVEQAFLRISGKQSSYEGEKIPIIEVGNVYELGKIVALRFLEWVSEHPNGVVALPTGIMVIHPYFSCLFFHFL
jgi:glucosamine-6-phosphate deaminase